MEAVLRSLRDTRVGASAPEESPRKRNVMGIGRMGGRAGGWSRSAVSVYLLHLFPLSSLSFPLCVCMSLFAIPLHAARRAMAARPFSRL